MHFLCLLRSASHAQIDKSTSVFVMKLVVNDFNERK